MLIFYFVLLITAVIITGSLIYSSLKLGISPMPSSSKAYDAMIKLVDETGTGPIVDLGSGWGTFVIRMAKINPKRQVVGYELSYLPWLTSILLKKVLELNNLTLYRKNFYQESLPVASVVVCYLYPDAMVKIKKKLRLEQPKIDFLLSNNFALPLSEPYKVVKLNDFYQSPIYLYKLRYA